MRSPWIAVMLSVLFLVAAPIAAIAQDWVVYKVSQPAYFTKDTKNWMKLRRGMRIPNTSWVHTGRHGRLRLQRGEEFILSSPNTVTRLHHDGQGKTYLRQQFGKLLLDVEARNHKHFTVKTPRLAAVVKGTRYSVQSNDRSASVSVSRGAVDVSIAGGGATTSVGPGQTASVSSSNAAAMSVSSNGTGSAGSSGPRAAMMVPMAAETVSKAQTARVAAMKVLTGTAARAATAEMMETMATTGATMVVTTAATMAEMMGMTDLACAHAQLPHSLNLKLA